MKVLLLNGSRNKEGCTYTALCEIADVIKQAGIETEIVHVGRDQSIEMVKEIATKVNASDGLVVGSPVYFASASGEITAFLDKLFCTGAAFAGKPGAAIASCRRGGASATLDQLNKYFTYSQMPLVSGNYWNMVHGNTPDEVKKDEEGMQTMRTVGKNMAWLLKCIEAGKKAGVVFPETEAKIKTNYIR